MVERKNVLGDNFEVLEHNLDQQISYPILYWKHEKYYILFKYK